MRGTNKISAAARLQTVLLFGELNSDTRVARVLSKQEGVHITSTTVRDRLNRENILLGYDKRHFEAVVARLRKEVEAEEAIGINLPSRSDAGKKITPEETVRTLEVFVEKHNFNATAKELGLAANTVRDRLYGILGPDRAHPAAAREKLAELKSEQ